MNNKIHNSRSNKQKDLSYIINLCQTHDIRTISNEQTDWHAMVKNEVKYSLHITYMCLSVCLPCQLKNASFFIFLFLIDFVRLYWTILMSRFIVHIQTVWKVCDNAFYIEHKTSVHFSGSCYFNGIVTQMIHGHSYIISRLPFKNAIACIYYRNKLWFSEMTTVCTTFYCYQFSV